MKNQQIKIPKSSRIIIKNLPPTLDEKSLADILSQYGQLTDCRIQFKGQKNRRFCYAGFMNVESATKALQNLNQTYIQSFKVSVQYSFLKNSVPHVKNQKKDEFQYDEKRIYVKNFPFTINEDQLESIFQPFGMIREIRILRKDGKSQGRGFVTFDDGNSVIKALADLNNKICFGRIIHLEQCRVHSNPQAEQNNIHDKIVNEQKSSFKKIKKKEMFQKIHDSSNWNSYFLNPNSIVNLMVQKLELKKKDLFDQEIENPAMIQTLIEKQILDETQDFLKKNGINMDSLNTKPSETERSSKIFLVKNIPSDAKIPKLRNLFERYGELKKFLIPSIKSILIVEYSNVQSALNAYEQLQDYKFQSTPIYLEWAPKNFFLMETPQNENLVKKNIDTFEQQNSNTVFIKNLSFKTTEQGLEDFINQNNLKGLERVKIVNQNGMSKGFGFATFDSSQNAQEMLKKLQKTVLDKHALQLSISQRKKENKQEIKKDEIPSDKLMIRNIPFQTNKQELKDLFNNIIEFKKLRVPKKLDGGLKGYVFLEFNSIEDCTKAKHELQNIHFYGRKLVLEYAKE